MAQDLQCEAEDDPRVTRGVRRRYNKQRCRRPMAKGFLPGGVRLMATGVVLHHSSPRYKAGGPLVLCPGPLPQLASWVNKGLDWGPVDDVLTLQSRIRDLLERDVSLVKVMQVMLVHQVLPCQRRSLCMWEFNPEGPRTIQQFFSVTLEGMYLFFGSQIECPDTSEDAGLNCNRPDTQVSNSAAEHVVF